MIRTITTLLLLATSAAMCQAQHVFRDVGQADRQRQLVLQKLHVAQAPLHTKQSKATEAEVEAYTQAVADAVIFQKWVASSQRTALEFTNDRKQQQDPHIRAKYVQLLWLIHDAEVRTQGPFGRQDIGVAIKLMNDIREVMKLPVELAPNLNALPGSPNFGIRMPRKP